MSVEATRESVAAEWSEWHGAVIKGIYPLRRVLHGSEHGAIFLTEAGPQGSGAAIKIVRAAQAGTGPQLQRWRAAATLSHPHLVRLFDFGLCQLEGESFCYVVMEHAEQTLSQLLPKRALSADEARQMLRPILEVLRFVHDRNLVHGQLSPAAVLVVDDQLKLASHSIRAAGEARLGGGKASLYDPPEADAGRLSPPGDVWALGITLVEALTQSLPWPDAQSGSASLPSLPTEFAPFVRRCLRHNPGSRPTAAELQAQLAGAAPAQPTAPAASVPPASPSSTAAHAASPSSALLRPARPPTAAAGPRATAPPPPAPERTSSTREPTKIGAAEPAMPAKHLPVTPIAAALLLAMALITWAGIRLFRGHAPSASPPAAVQPAPAAPVAAAPSATSERPALTPPPTPNASARSNAPAAVSDSPVVHAQIPAVPRSALRTIRGHVKVTVLVNVDRVGNVVDAVLQYAGSSPYFARLAREAARKWQFAPAAAQESRKWLVKFEFSRDGATGHASPHP